MPTPVQPIFLLIMVNLILIITLLGFIPFGDFAKHSISLVQMLLLEWGILLYIGVVFLKNKWLKSWFIWVVICLILQYNRYSYAFANTILLYVIFYQVLTDKLNQKNTHRILNCICIVAWINACWMVLQYFRIWELHACFPVKWWLFRCDSRAGWHVFGFVGNSNNAGMLLALSIPAFLRKKVWVLLFGLIPVLLLSRHETSYIAATVGLTIYSIIKYPKCSLAIISGVILLGIGTFFLIRKPENPAYSVSIRIEAWERVLKIIKTSPLQGLGLGQFRNVFQAIDRMIFKQRLRWVCAHNVPLQTVFEQGVLGLGLISGFVFSNIERFLKNKTTLGIIGLTGIIIAIVGSCAHFLSDTTSMILPVIYMAIMVSQTKRMMEEKHGKRNFYGYNAGNRAGAY